MTRSPFEASPASLARRLELELVDQLVDQLVVNDAHRRRASVRLASRFPPTAPGPSDVDVRQVVDDTAPPTLDEELLA